MIHLSTFSIFDSYNQTIVNPINCVGVMGAGLAKQFKDRYPDMFDKYRELCDCGGLTIGKSFLYKSKTQKWVYNFPTKDHWHNSSKIEYLELGLKNFIDTYERRGITSISFPLLGAGLGGLKKDEVKELMMNYLKDLPIMICIHV